ncbi:MAG: adenylyl-sulfate kinase [Lysobacter sp.]
MGKRILVCGLPGSGKTTLASALVKVLPATHIDGDAARSVNNDWDFSPEGRVRQALRMREIADQHEGMVVASFVCPTEATRAAFAPDLIVLMDTLKESRYPDTDAIFERPTEVAVQVVNQIMQPTLERIAACLRFLTPQGTMIGRYQPWHDGHTALFEQALARSGYVGIGVRTVQPSPSNPYTYQETENRIHLALQHRAGCYHVYPVPDVRGVYYGRDVGYDVERIELPPEIEAIRATDIRAQENGHA